jgi:hypothetical protein
MSRFVLLAIAYWGLSIGVSLQVPQSAPFTIHVTKIQRVNGGCAVDAESTSIRFKLRSSVPAACAMLKAGESYEAFRAITTTDPKDETKDSSSLVIANNVKNSRRPNAVFAIDSEESIPQKLETGWTHPLGSTPLKRADLAATHHMQELVGVRYLSVPFR